MPRRDGTGPMQAGAMAGRRLGLCSGTTGTGLACGRGLGCGFGRKNGFSETSSQDKKDLLQNEKDILKNQIVSIDKQLGNM